DRERFYSKTLPDLETGCWNWTAFRLSTGYGKFRLRGLTVTAHRVAWVDAGGELVDGLELDHLCRDRSCVNPEHLEQIPHATNVRRGDGGAFHAAKTHCPRGHEYNEENTRRAKGKRHCRSCGREDMRRRRARERA